MEELTLPVRIVLAVFGLGGVVALAVVPWACIGTGLFEKDKRYQSRRGGS